MSWIQDIISPQTRKWEEFYRNRFQHDRIVRSTHGVNCTGGCSWQIHVKDGIVVWETQQLDYPLLEDSLPPYEPRGCQRGISYSWYLYSPLRIKYPLIRGALIDAFEREKACGQGRRAGRLGEPAEGSEEARDLPEGPRQGRLPPHHLGHGARADGGGQHLHRQEARPRPRLRLLTDPGDVDAQLRGRRRFLQLFGGVNLSFYDWYCDLPTAFPEIWGEQTDVCESADWYNAKMIADMGACLNMTRTPDCHFFAESRHNGTKAVVFSPDFSQVCKYADQWVPAARRQRRRVLDGRLPRDPEGVPPRQARPRTSSTTSSSTRTAPSW